MGRCHGPMTYAACIATGVCRCIARSRTDNSARRRTARRTGRSRSGWRSSGCTRPTIRCRRIVRGSRSKRSSALITRRHKDSKSRPNGRTGWCGRTPAKCPLEVSSGVWNSRSRAGCRTASRRATPNQSIAVLRCGTWPADMPATIADSGMRGRSGFRSPRILRRNRGCAGTFHRSRSRYTPSMT